MPPMPMPPMLTLTPDVDVFEAFDDGGRLTVALAGPIGVGLNFEHEKEAAYKTYP